MVKGKTIYVPPLVMLEVEDIMRKQKLPRAKAFNEFTNYAKVGRAVKNLTGVDFAQIMFNQNKKRGLF